VLLADLTDETREFWRNALQNQGLSVARLGDLDYTQSETLTAQQVSQSPVAKLISNQMILADQHNLLLIWLTSHMVL
jgi:hypothetical protein